MRCDSDRSKDPKGRHGDRPGRKPWESGGNARKPCKGDIGKPLNCGEAHLDNEKSHGCQRACAMSPMQGSILLISTSQGLRGRPTIDFLLKNEPVSPLFSTYEFAKNQLLDSLLRPGLSLCRPCRAGMNRYPHCLNRSLPSTCIALRRAQGLICPHRREREGATEAQQVAACMEALWHRACKASTGTLRAYTSLEGENGQ